MAFRLRVLHSLLLGLAGFSLMLCSFFYATPVALHYGENTVAQLSVLDAVGPSAPVSPLSLQQDSSTATENGTTNIEPVVGGKRTLQVATSRAAAAAAAAASANGALSEREIEHRVKDVVLNVSGPSGGSGPGSAPIAPKVIAPVPPESTIILPKAAPANASRQSVIQHINPKGDSGGSISSSNNGGSSNVAATDFTSLGIVTRTMYESGHDIPNAELCPEFGKSLKVVILITSAPSHSDARMAIRQTWGHYGQRKDVSIAFLIGATPDVNLQKDIYSESEMYSDIIQSHFQDSYNNLTLKTISLLEWVDTYCYQVGFILKTDDDMFINIPKLIAFIDKHVNDKRTIFGRLAKKWKPIRNKKSKYYVSKEQYKHVLFPDFTTGPAYLMTSDVVHDLYTSALNQTYLKLEDVYTTGIVAQEMKVKRVHVNEFLNKRIVFHACHVQKGISIHMVKFHEQFDLWKKLLDGKTKCK